MRIDPGYTCLLLLLVTLAWGPVQAAGENPLDTVVVMDSSGSMKQTDPRELRKPAARLFITLLGEQDRLSVMSFSDNAYPITYLTELKDSTNRERSLNATDKVSSKGIYTNIYAAIARAIDMLKESDQMQREPIIVLMSDGKIDVGDAAESARLRDRIMQELVPQLKQHNIKIYSIAFTEQSDQVLLQDIADATDGRYALAASDDVLHKVFAKIFEQSKQPNMLPLTENAFLVDPSIREITIIANKKSEQSKIYLQNPDGERINSTFKSEYIKWFVSSSFDMITLTRPQEGEWKILFSDDENRAYIIADIKLRTRFEYNSQSNYPELTIRTWLEKDDEIVARNELVSNMELSLEIEHPDGTIEQRAIEAANDEGIFVIQFRPTMDGIYAATVIALSRTFQRQQVFSFRATLPRQPVVAEPPAMQPETPEPPVEDVPAEPIDREQPEDDLGKSIMIFLLANLVLVFIGLNVFFFLKMKKSKK